MIKWFVYIVVLLIFAPCLSSAKIKNSHFIVYSYTLDAHFPVKEIASDTVVAKNNKKPEPDDKGKIKEVTKAKKQPKPEKVEPDKKDESKAKKRPKRQRRPEGMERPPEIPRRSGN